jgi:hypothetical protein
MKKKKIYTYRNAEMLIAAKTVSKSFSDNITLLSSVRNNWTPEYAADLARRIDEAIDNYLAIDKKKDLRNATSYMVSISAPALRDLTSFRIQVKLDFKTEAAEILTSLGFKNHYSNAKSKRSQEALIANLVGFSTGMNDELKNRLTSKGMKPELIERILSYSKDFRDANMVQEVLKESTKMITDEARLVFKNIYEEVMNICKIAYPCYEFDPLIRQQFNFSNVIRNMTAAGKKSDTGSDAAMETEPESEVITTSLQ